MAVIVANKTGETDGSAYQMLSQINSKLPIVLVSRCENFVFNDELKNLKDYVLVDFVEYGHNREFDNTHFFGENTFEKFPDLFDTKEWEKFDDWVRYNPSRLYFKRELLEKDRVGFIKPIEYAAWYEPQNIQTRKEFDSRPLQVFFTWGYSSEHRRQLHGKIWTQAHSHDYMVCDNLLYLSKFIEQESNPKKWASINIPHYQRYAMEDVLNMQSLSKISISHWGAGKKCFRSAESPLNSIMALPYDDYAWTYEWESGINCLKFHLWSTIFEIESYLRSPGDLYGIYREGVETCRNYYMPNYCNHLEKLINNA